MSEGLIQYDLQHYTDAIEILQKVLKNDPLNIKAKFYISMSYIETGKFDLAISNLETLATHNNHILIDQIKWYLALCYLKINDLEKAIPAFTELANSQNYCKDKSKTILEKLKEDNF